MMGGRMADSQTASADDRCLHGIYGRSVYSNVSIFHQTGTLGDRQRLTSALSRTPREVRKKERVTT